MDKSFKQLFQHHDGKISDKWSSYLDEWDRVFAPIREKRCRLLEIGIQNGGSLEIWSKYFYKAEKIVGCDIDPKCSLLQFNDVRIEVIIGDVNSDSCKQQILQHAEEFDVVIDDGSHKSSDIISSFANYFPALNDEGVYLVEDLHCSYWDEYEGGVYNPFSAMAFFKRLADIINYEHWRKNLSRSELLARFAEKFDLVFLESDLLKIHSIEFINSLCIIKKSSRDNNLLGQRIVVGTEEGVTTEAKAMNGTLLQDYSPAILDDDMDVFALIDKNEQMNTIILSQDQAIGSLNEQLKEAISYNDQVIQSLINQLAESKQHIHSMNSRITKFDQGIQDLSKRLSEANQKLHQITLQYTSAEMKIENLTVQLADTEHELLSLVLSQSWRITRPLRKIRSLIRRHK